MNIVELRQTTDTVEQNEMLADAEPIDSPLAATKATSSPPHSPKTFTYTNKYASAMPSPPKGTPTPQQKPMRVSISTTSSWSQLPAPPLSPNTSRILSSAVNGNNTNNNNNDNTQIEPQARVDVTSDGSWRSQFTQVQRDKVIASMYVIIYYTHRTQTYNIFSIRCLY